MFNGLWHKKDTNLTLRVFGQAQFIITGMIIFSYLTDFRYFSLKKINSECCKTRSEQVKNGDFERGCRWFKLFFIQFQLFNFLARIIPVIYVLHVHVSFERIIEKNINPMSCYRAFVPTNIVKLNRYLFISQKILYIFI